jgi:hypothetical protein
MARRVVDDEPPNAAIAHGLKLGRQHLDVPAWQERSAGVQFREAPQQGRIEICAQGRVILAR